MIVIGRPFIKCILIAVRGISTLSIVIERPFMKCILIAES